MQLEGPKECKKTCLRKELYNYVKYNCILLSIVLFINKLSINITHIDIISNIIYNTNYKRRFIYEQ